MTDQTPDSGTAREEPDGIARRLRRVARWQFRLRGLATIKDIPTDRFNSIMAGLLQAGWRKTYEYQGHDAWIDYGCVRMRKGRWRLKFEWDNWMEGSIEGKRKIVERVAADEGLTAIDEWRWS